MNNAQLIPNKTIIHYHLLGSFIVFCYLIVSLAAKTFWENLLVIVVWSLAFIAAIWFCRNKRPVWQYQQIGLKNQLQQLRFDWTYYVCATLAVFFTEISLVHQPIILATKDSITLLSIGIYTALSLILALERERIQSLTPIDTPDITKIVPIERKTRYFISLILILGLINFMIHFSIQQNKGEILFSGSMIIIFSCYLFYLYQRNFCCTLDIQVNKLRHIEEGKFDIDVPIISNDEFALLANYYNTMINNMHDRERLYKTLEKSVGTDIMNKLLTTDEQTLKQGQMHNVAILFCDLRGFSILGESAAAEEIILFLNVYFADISSVITEHNGIINKFIGDAVLAIFGLNGEGNPVEDAVHAGIAIIEHGVDLYMPNAMHPETGVGIDFGTVIAGTIGSDERYEYTIIGDAVNKASRLEGLSKRLNYSIILSQEAYQQLSNDICTLFCDLGAHRVRGRSKPISVYGCKQKNKDDTCD